MTLLLWYCADGVTTVTSIPYAFFQTLEHELQESVQFGYLSIYYHLHTSIRQLTKPCKICKWSAGHPLVLSKISANPVESGPSASAGMLRLEEYGCSSWLEVEKIQPLVAADGEPAFERFSYRAVELFYRFVIHQRWAANICTATVTVNW